MSDQIKRSGASKSRKRKSTPLGDQPLKNRLTVKQSRSLLDSIRKYENKRGMGKTQYKRSS